MPPAYRQRDGNGLTHRWSGPRRRYNSLVVERRACAAAAAQRQYVSPMRKLTLIISVALCASLVANSLLLRRAARLDATIRWERAQAQREGEAQADVDYAAGQPCWYVVGDFGGVPPEKAGRRLVKSGCMTSEHRSTFAWAYNARIDERVNAAGVSATGR